MLHFLKMYQIYKLAITVAQKTSEHIKLNSEKGTHVSEATGVWAFVPFMWTWHHLCGVGAFQITLNETI